MSTERIVGILLFPLALVVCVIYVIVVSLSFVAFQIDEWRLARKRR